MTAGLWSLGENDDAIVTAAVADQCRSYVLKPQREGGCVRVRRTRAPDACRQRQQSLRRRGDEAADGAPTAPPSRRLIAPPAATDVDAGATPRLHSDEPHRASDAQVLVRCSARRRRRSLTRVRRSVVRDGVGTVVDAVSELGLFGALLA